MANGRKRLFGILEKREKRRQKPRQSFLQGGQKRRNRRQTMIMQLFFSRRWLYVFISACVAAVPNRSRGLYSGDDVL